MRKHWRSVPGDLSQPGECPAQHGCFCLRDAAHKARQRGRPVAGLIERMHHQLGYIRFPARRSLVLPGAASSLARDNPFLCQPIQNGHYRGVGKITVGQAQANLTDCEGFGVVPENIHDRALKLAQPIHGVTLSRAKVWQQARCKWSLVTWAGAFQDEGLRRGQASIDAVRCCAS